MCIRDSITPVPEYEGPVSADDYVLAIGLEGTETKPDDYLVAQEGITEHSGALSAVTNDVTYIRSGPQNVKTGTTLSLIHIWGRAACCRRRPRIFRRSSL